jgi:hypothetical protein
MVGIPGLYFIVARDDRARFVRPDPDNGLHTIDIADLGSPCEPDDDPATRAFLRTGLPGAALPDACEPRHVRFARRLAVRINEDFAVDVFSHLVLVAPAHVLHELIAMMDVCARDSLIGSLSKDLELWPHFLPWLVPIQTTRARARPLNRR